MNCVLPQSRHSGPTSPVLLDNPGGKVNQTKDKHPFTSRIGSTLHPALECLVNI
jgi:hypothetical protein